jgi:hypothetical protein
MPSAEVAQRLVLSILHAVPPVGEASMGLAAAGAPAAGILVAVGGFTTLCLAGSLADVVILAAGTRRRATSAAP